jgi:hypothetical protein
MELNLSNHQIAQELDLNQDDVLLMTTPLGSGIVANKPADCLEGETPDFWDDSTSMLATRIEILRSRCENDGRLLVIASVLV